MKRFAYLSLALPSLLLFFAITGAAQNTLGPKNGVELKPADLERVKPGAEAPDFTLENLDGKPLSLSDYREQKSVVLVFYRGYW